MTRPGEMVLVGSRKYVTGQDKLENGTGPDGLRDEWADTPQCEQCKGKPTQPYAHWGRRQPQFILVKDLNIDRYNADTRRSVDWILTRRKNSEIIS